MKSNDLKFLKNTFNSFAKDVIKKSRKKLKANSRLAKSLDYEVEFVKGNLKLIFEQEEYGKFKDLGVKGKDPFSLPKKARKFGKQQAPLSPYKFGSGKYKGKGRLRDGINGMLTRSKKANVRSKETGRFLKRKSLIFLISRSIYRSGIKPSLFFTTPFNLAYKRLPNDIRESYAKDVEAFLKKTTKR